MNKSADVQRKKANFVVKSAKAVLREQEVRRTEMLQTKRRPVVQAKRSGEQLLASN
jgi:hypothetical protein